MTVLIQNYNEKIKTLNLFNMKVLKLLITCEESISGGLLKCAVSAADVCDWLISQVQNHGAQTLQGMEEKPLYSPSHMSI